MSLKFTKNQYFCEIIEKRNERLMVKRQAFDFTCSGKLCTSVPVFYLAQTPNVELLAPLPCKNQQITQNYEVFISFQTKQLEAIYKVLNATCSAHFPK